MLKNIFLGALAIGVTGAIGFGVYAYKSPSPLSRQINTPSLILSLLKRPGACLGRILCNLPYRL